MSDLGANTRREILSQPDVWAASLEHVATQSGDLRRLWASEPFDSVVFTGCGSTYYLGMIAATTLRQMTGAATRAVPASELLLYPESVYGNAENTLLVAISRSGETTETIHACRAFLAERRGRLITFSCYPDQPLAEMGAVNVVLADAQEESIVQTRAFTSLLLGVLHTAALWGDRQDVLHDLARLPAAGRRVIETSFDATSALGAETADIEHFCFLGSGPQYGLACEASLKMKEVSLTRSEPFHFFEFRHGPKSIVDPATLVVGLYSGRHQALEREVVEEMRALGGRAWTLAEQDADVAFGSGLDEEARGLLALLPVQWLAVERAVRAGYDPDRPKNLDAVVRLTMPG